MRTWLALGASAMVAAVLGVSLQSITTTAQQPPPAATVTAKAWDQILGPAEGTIPPPRPSVGSVFVLPTHRQATARTNIEWESDLKKALVTAKRENRPVFVTLRCLPCKSCSEFDKAVLEGGADLDPLFRQFVTVRLTSTKDIDFRLLPMDQFQDMDVSWWSWFISPEGRVYGVFGGRDKSGDETRTSKASLVATMKRVLAHHYDPRRPAWDIDGPAPVTTGEPTTPMDLPGFGSWLSLGNNKEMFNHHGCIHCHQTSEILRQGEIDAGRFDKRRDLQPWPFPENIGVVVNRDDGLAVQQVRPGSPAAAIGIRSGDLIAAAGGRRLFSQADLRAVLHRAPLGNAKIEIVWLRGGKPMTGTLDLADGWRKTDLSWRASVSEGNVGARPGFWPGEAGAARARLGIANDTMAVKPFIGPKMQSPAISAGLKGTDVVTAVNGQSPPIANREWNIWFRMMFEPGDAVTLTVRSADGKERQINFKTDR
jgi:hypothetical protein